MRILLRSIILSFIFCCSFTPSGFGQDAPSVLRTKVDAVVASAYKSASVKFPCKLKARGKAKILRWQDLGKCVNGAYDRVDWDALSVQLQKIQKNSRYDVDEMYAVIEESLTAHAVRFDEVFRVKDEKALLPLSNSLLKFLPPGSLLDLRVYDKSGTHIGAFAGVYTFEKYGQISGSKYTQSLFQYTNIDGNIRTPTDKLLLDNFGIPWKDAASQPGFRLPADKLKVKN